MSSNCVSVDGVSVGRPGSYHGIEHGQQFARARDDDELTRLSGREEALLEGPESRGEPAGGERCQIEAAPDHVASAPYAALAATVSRVIGVWCQSGERRDPPSVELTKFRELRNQRC